MGSGGSNAGAGGGGGGVPTTPPTGGKAPEPPPDLPSRANQPFSSFPDDPVVNPGGTLTGTGVKAEMAPKTDAIYAYTGGYVKGGDRFAGLSAEDLNKALYDKKNFIAQHGQAKYKAALNFRTELNTELNTLRNYQGEVYRVIGNPTIGGQKLAETFQPGRPVHFNEFLSTSRTITPSYKPFSAASSGVEAGQIRFMIQSKSGKLVERVSSYEAEREVLFRSGTSFMIQSKTYNQARKVWDIRMTEI